jgi:hypothetical protein
LIDSKIQYKKYSFSCNFYEIKTGYQENDKLIKFLTENKIKRNESHFSTFFDNKQIIETLDLKFFKDFISQHLMIFIMTVLNKKSFSFTASWFQAYRPNDFHDAHIHGSQQDQYSLIYYVNCTDESAVTAFYGPMHPYVHSHNDIHIKPEKSKLVIFPSYLPHSAWPNKDEERIIFSANFKVE